MLDTQINSKVIEAEKELVSVWGDIDSVKNYVQIKVLNAFREIGLQNSHYSWVTGYGYDDLGKDKLDQLYAMYFNTEAAIARIQLVSGTHAIHCAVLGQLNSGDEMVSITGKPYDTLQTVFSTYEDKYGIYFKYGLENVSSKTKLVLLQRSRGYEWRDSYDITYLKDLISKAKAINPNIIVFVDNCYGEFTQTLEPTDVGADIVAGSMIKNPGGGIVAAGGYIAGSKDCVERAANIMTAPGIGTHGGCSFDQNRLMFQGFFMAPLVVSEALKGMTLAAKIFSELGLETLPNYDSKRNDIIQAVKFNNADKLVQFCSLVQKYSAVNSMFTPIPDDISGYEDQVIMASGSFVEGSSIELSADGPLRAPYIGYFQGGLSYAHTRYVLSKILDEYS